MDDLEVPLISGNLRMKIYRFYKRRRSANGWLLGAGKTGTWWFTSTSPFDISKQHLFAGMMTMVWHTVLGDILICMAACLPKQGQGHDNDDLDGLLPDMPAVIT